MKFKKKAVIFDLDGVICFTDRFHYQAWKALADRLGIYFDEKINDRLRGVSRMASLEIILERATETYTQEQKEAFAEEKNNTYRELLKNMSPADLTDEVKDDVLSGYARTRLACKFNLYCGRHLEPVESRCHSRSHVC